MQALQRRILAHDERLALSGPPPAPSRAILVLTRDDATLGALVALASPLAADASCELVIAALLDDDAQLRDRTARLNRVQQDAARAGVLARVAAFTSVDPAADAVRLAMEQDVALLLLDAPDEMLRPASATGHIAATLDRALCDVALVAGAARRTTTAGRGVVVPFGGHEHDWAAVELGAWLARATGMPLHLLGTRADPGAGRRDASRLLGHASIALQRGLGVTAESVLVAPGADAIIDVSQRGGLLVIGLSHRFAREGLGAARTAIARRAAVPVVLVRRGLRPGGLAPARALTRFTWSAG
jgi:hypothetical protein